MIYSIFDFPTLSRIETYFTSTKDADIECRHKTQCVVMQATSAEDERYLGLEWQCTHCIPATTCVYCNPEYKEARLQPCYTCGDTGVSTWHVDGKCLPCQGEEA